ncbi:MAG: hypothetical protein ACREEY_07195 [Brevundimonas sp.]
MKDFARGRGALAATFSAIAFKRLTAVETDATRSNQHEFNGGRALMKLFGPEGPQRVTTDFVWMPDDGDFVREEGLLTWYDARARHPTRSEYRLYYVGNDVTSRAREGDLLVIARKSDGATLMLLAPGSGLAATRIAWMFGLEAEPGAAFAAFGLDAGDRSRIQQAFSGADAAPEDWAGENAGDLAQADPSIRASLLRMQKAIGEERDVEDDAGSWVPEPEMI